MHGTGARHHRPSSPFIRNTPASRPAAGTARGRPRGRSRTPARPAARPGSSPSRRGCSPARRSGAGCTGALAGRVIVPEGSTAPGSQLIVARKLAPPVRYSDQPISRSWRCGRIIDSTARTSSSNICSSVNRSTPVRTGPTSGAGPRRRCCRCPHGRRPAPPANFADPHPFEPRAERSRRAGSRCLSFRFLKVVTVIATAAEPVDHLQVLRFRRVSLTQRSPPPPRRPPSRRDARRDGRASTARIPNHPNSPTIGIPPIRSSQRHTRPPCPSPCREPSGTRITRTRPAPPRFRTPEMRANSPRGDNISPPRGSTSGHPTNVTSGNRSTAPQQSRVTRTASPRASRVGPIRIPRHLARPRLLLFAQSTPAGAGCHGLRYSAARVSRVRGGSRAGEYASPWHPTVRPDFSAREAVAVVLARRSDARSTQKARGGRILENNEERD